jgi:aerobic-type carbon monoxide dehydrogenase small subunit (CoxS/CutS family)
VCPARPMRAPGAPNTAYSRQIMSQNNGRGAPAINSTKNHHCSRCPLLSVGGLAGREVVTIESIVENKANPVVMAWIEEQVPQCGYCQAGQIMAASALLARHPRPTDADIDREMTNICRCGTYAEIRGAIRKASALMSRG